MNKKRLGAVFLALLMCGLVSQASAQDAEPKFNSHADDLTRIRGLLDEFRQDIIRKDCAPQKVDPTSRCNFFEPVFMVQPAENILRSYPAIGWQLMAMDAWARPRPAVGIRNAWSQARMGSSPIVVGNPLPQDRPKMLFAQRNHVIQAFTADRSHQPFTVRIRLRRLHGGS